VEQARASNQGVGLRARALLLLALAACGESAAKKKPDAGVDAGSGSAAPCVLDTSTLDRCSL
jgi:hypothetical protein